MMGLFGFSGENAIGVSFQHFSGENAIGVSLEITVLFGTMQLPSIYIAGGCSQAKEKDCLKTCERLGFVKNADGTVNVKNELMPSLNHERRGATLAFLEPLSTLTCIGGCSTNGNHLSTLEYHNFKSSTEFNWILDSPKTALGHSCAAAVTQGHEITVFGGWDGMDCLKSVQKFTFDPVKQRFAHELMKSLMDGLKNTAALTAVNQQCLATDKAAYLFGGWDGKRTLNTIFKYNLQTQEQTMFGLLPTAVECHSVAYHRPSDSAYITGGFDGITVNNTVLRCQFNNEELSVQCEKLQDVQLNVARECHGSAILDDYLVVFGGWDGFKALKSIEMFRILKEKPYLCEVNVHGSLLEPRNRPAYCVCDENC